MFPDVICLDESNAVIFPAFFLTVSHALVQMWCPSGSLRLSSSLHHNVSLSAWLLLPSPRIFSPVRVPWSQVTSSLCPSEYLGPVCGQKPALQRGPPAAALIWPTGAQPQS